MSIKPELQNEIRILNARKEQAETELSGIQKKTGDAALMLRQIESEVVSAVRRGEQAIATADSHVRRREDHEAVLLEQHRKITEHSEIIGKNSARVKELAREIEVYAATGKDREKKEQERIARLFREESALLERAHEERVQDEILTIAMRIERKTLREEIDTSIRENIETRQVLAEELAEDEALADARRTELRVQAKKDNEGVERERKEIDAAIETGRIVLAELGPRVSDANEQLEKIQLATGEAERARDHMQEQAVDFGSQVAILRKEINALTSKKTVIEASLSDKLKEHDKQEALIKRLAEKERELSSRERWIRAMFKKLGHEYR